LTQFFSGSTLGYIDSTIKRIYFTRLDHFVARPIGM